MSIVTDITTIVTNLYPDSNFQLLSRFNSNSEAFFTDSTELPLIILNNNINKNAEIKQNNNVIKDTRIIMYILKLDNDDNTDLESEQLRSDCELIADKIVGNIYQLLEVRPIGNQKYTIKPEFNVFASNLTGVSLEMNINYNEVVKC